MAVYAYTALDRTGRRTAGTIPADNKAAAMDQVISQGLSPVSIVESGNGAAAAEAPARASVIDTGDSPWLITWSIAAALLSAGIVPAVRRPERSSAV